MIRLFISNDLQTKKSFILDDKALHYLSHVMRQKTGDEILCFNGKDGEWLCGIEKIEKKSLTLIPQKQIRKQTCDSFCALCPALIKKDNMDIVLQKATELGVSDIYPLVTDYTVVRHFNLTHAESIVREASEQSERLTVPHIHSPISIKELFRLLPEKCACCYLSEREDNIVAPDITTNSVAFLVGPEGGWSPTEKESFRKNDHFLPIHFPGGILRAETASIAILSCWKIGRFLPWKK